MALPLDYDALHHKSNPSERSMIQLITVSISQNHFIRLLGETLLDKNQILQLYATTISKYSDIETDRHSRVETPVLYLKGSGFNS
jgi:hypothetical protein